MSDAYTLPPRRAGRFSALRARLAEAGGTFRKVVAVNRILIAPKREPAPPVDRAALVNYATFLAWERDRVCAELYPHLGAKAAGFVLGSNAAERFFHPAGRPGTVGARPGHVAPASSRAVKVLDLVGIDWRGDLPGDGIEHRLGGDLIDTGARPAVPHGWPNLDAALVTAAGDLGQLDAATAALLKGDARDAHDVPGYQSLEDDRSDVLAVLIGERARTLPGLQAKARALRSLELRHDPDTSMDLGMSLARDILGADDRVIEPRPDPIFAALDELRRREAAVAADYAERPEGAEEPPEVLQRREELWDAFWIYWRETVLKTVPATAAGCIALCRYVVDYLDRERIDLNEGKDGVQHDVLRLLLKSPLL